ncbi:MAG: hypothetical protein HOQ24_10400, partial [Mycobacteriaceae bacterium]|nr:hypothetical protein [Mycobacteriaceae bacterium]
RPEPPRAPAPPPAPSRDTWAAGHRWSDASATSRMSEPEAARPSARSAGDAMTVVYENNAVGPNQRSGQDKSDQIR